MNVYFPQKKPTFTSFLWKHDIIFRNTECGLDKCVKWGAFYVSPLVLNAGWVPSVSYKPGNDAAGLSVKDVKWLLQVCLCKMMAVVPCSWEDENRLQPRKMLDPGDRNAICGVMCMLTLGYRLICLLSWTLESLWWEFGRVYEQESVF